jgi:hypothetical protein
VNQNGVYGTLGSPAAGNIPGGRFNASSWIDSSGNLWLFGGNGLDSIGTEGYLNDLWEFSPSTREWTWIGGSSTASCHLCGQPGVYGTLGTPAGNGPGGRYIASSWIDSSGNFWLFGGFGFDSIGALGYLNDLWEFNPSTKQWTWVAGSDTEGSSQSALYHGQPGVYGTLAVPADGNVPGGRALANSWTDNAGNLWLFGGEGYDSTGWRFADLNELWKFNPSTKEWTWMGGSSTAPSTDGGQPGIYGTLGTSAPGNVPGARTNASSLTDTSGNLWLFGGAGFDSTDAKGPLNDLWEYQPSATTLPSAATPTFSLPSGTYATSQNVTISDATTGATIYYAINGTPTTASIEYIGPITVTSTGTIEAIATASGYSTSAVATATYTINISTPSPAATPTFSIPSGTYSSAQTVTVSDATTGATIYFTTNGTTPTTSSTQYTGPITVSSTETFEAIATASGYSTSAVATATYTVISTPASTILVGAPNLSYSFYGMCCNDNTSLAAEFTLSSSAYVTTVDVVLLGSSIYDFSLQNSLTGSITTFANAVLVAPSAGSNTVPMSINATLPPGTYYLVGTEDPASTLTVPGWWVSDGTLITQAGNVSNGLWSSSGGPHGNWTFESGVIGPYTYDAPTFTVNGSVLGVPVPIVTVMPYALSVSSTQALPVTVTVNGGAGNPTPTGSITLAGGGYTSGATTLSSGSATINIPAGSLTTGTDTLTANFTPDTASSSTYESASGSALVAVTNLARTTPNVMVTPSLSSLTSTQSLSVTAALSGGSGSPTPTGAVSLTVNGYTYISTNLNGGSAMINIPSGLLVPGTDTLTVNYTPDAASSSTYNSAVGSASVTVTAATPQAATPTFNPPAGSYASGQSVTLGDATPGAVIYYTTNGTTPTTSSTQYTSSITVSSTETIEAIATASGYSTSAVAAATYTIGMSTQSPAATPTFSPSGGTYTSAQTVTISDATAGAMIYYTTNGTTPTTSSTQYTYPIAVSSTETIEAIATASGYSTSAVAIATYTITGTTLAPAATPTFSPPSGTYTAPQTVTISDATTGATIYFTTNGTTPTTSSTQYTGPITVSSTETIEAIATASGYSTSTVATATYTIILQAQTGPSVSAAYQELHQRAVANASNFYVYQDQDSGLNHGYPSGWFGTISAITIDTGCIDNPADTVTGCYPSSNTTALDLTHGTVFRVTFASLASDQFAGLNIEEPLNWGANGQPASNGYNLTGATAVSLDVRSPGGISVQFGVNSCTTSFIRLPASTTYTTMTFTLDTNSLSCTPDLTSVHLLFTVVTNGSEAGAGGTVLMDNIRFTPVPPRTAQGSETLSLPLSTQTFGVVPQTQAPFPPDQANRNIAATYEAALSVLGFLARGTPQDLVDAQSIANALDYALHNDNQGDPLPVAPDGSAGLHNAYSSGDIALLNGQSTGALAGNVRLAGFTCGSASPTGFCLELEGATGGNNAFAILALLAAYRQFGNVTYLNDALEIANWIVGNLKDPAGTGYGGYFVGYQDQVPPALNKGKSIENNADIFAAFTALAAVENELSNAQQVAQWTGYAKVAGDFVVQMFDSASGHFYAGTVLIGSPPKPAAGNCQTPYMSKGNDVINTCDFLDSNTFTTLAMAGSGTYQNSIDWTRPINYVSTVYLQTISANALSFQGVDIIPPPPAGLAWEFTGQSVETCQYVASLLTSSSCGTLAQTDLAQIGQAQTSAPFGDGMGLVAATVNGENAPPNNLPPLDECLQTPFQCIPERVGLAATVWAILASEHLDVFSPFPGANVSASSLTFVGQQVETTSATQTVTLSNTGSVGLTISSITATGTNASAFGVTNTCGASLAAGANCTISVTFTPTATGTLTASLAITDNALTSPQTVSLTGTGTGQSFALAVSSNSSSSQTVAPGATATYTLTATSIGGFSQAVSLTCSGAPAETSCQVLPTSVTPSASGTNITVAVTTTAPSVGVPQSRPLLPVPPPSSGLRGLLLLTVFLAMMTWALRRRKQFGVGRWQLALLPLGAGLMLILALAGCGGGTTSSTNTTSQNPGTPPGTYTLTVTGTTGSGSATLSHSVKLTLTVS